MKGGKALSTTQGRCSETLAHYPRTPLVTGLADACDCQKHNPSGCDHSDAIGSRRALFVVRLLLTLMGHLQIPMGLCFNHTQLIRSTGYNLPPLNATTKTGRAVVAMIWDGIKRLTAPSSLAAFNIYINMVGALQE